MSASPAYSKTYKTLKRAVSDLEDAIRDFHYTDDDRMSVNAQIESAKTRALTAMCTILSEWEWLRSQITKELGGQNGRDC